MLVLLALRGHYLAGHREMPRGSFHSRGTTPESKHQFFLAVGVSDDGAFIIATGIGLWFATANPFR